MSPRHLETRVRILVILAFVIGSLLVVVPPASAACYWHSGQFTFDKSTNTNSTLYYRYRNSCDTLVYQTDWRSGSGVNKNECDRGRGWLPNGNYDVGQTSHDWNGSAIDGRVWYLSDKACAANGTIRSALFIHTEERSAGANNCDGNSSTDNAYCWDGNNDYKSQGCIKLATSGGDAAANDDVGDAHWYWHNRAGGGDGAGPWRNKVRVVA